MNSNNASQIMPQPITLAALAELIATAGVFNGCKLHLYSNSIVPTPQTALSALTEPTFTGYAPVAAIAFAAPGNLPPGGGFTNAPSLVFTCTAGPATDTIYGWFLTDSASAVLKLIVPLATPVQIALTGDSVVIQPEIDFSGT